MMRPRSARSLVKAPRLWLSMVLVCLALRAGAAPAVEKTTPEKLPAGFVDLAEVAPDVVLDMRYADADNFMGHAARGYRAPRCLLTRQAAEALAAVQRELSASGVGLKVYDCYRPQRAVDDFVVWSRAPGAVTDPRHNPDIPKSQLFKRGYIATRSGHSRGSTVDLTLVPAGAKAAGTEPAPATDCRAIDGPLAPDGSLNMGTTFDCFDERTHGASTAVPAEARRNREILAGAMKKHGFVPYAREWWHFTLANEPFPKTAFDFEIAPATP